MSAWYNKTMAFPATYDFNYYKGDTFEFRIYPKKNDGTAYLLGDFQMPTNFANNPDYVLDTSATYDSAQFTIAEIRGGSATKSIRCFATISDDQTFIQCAIRPSDSHELEAGIEYVYDVEVRSPAGKPNNLFYEKVYTLMTGTITVTDQVSGAKENTRGTLSNYNIQGVTRPVKGATPVTNVFETAEHSGTISWFQSDGITPLVGNFAASTVYVAKITLTVKPPYYISGTPANKFTVEHASVVTNLINSGIVTAVFPATGA
jgi:hypothetical protein